MLWEILFYLHHLELNSDSGPTRPVALANNLRLVQETAFLLLELHRGPDGASVAGSSKSDMDSMLAASGRVPAAAVVHSLHTTLRVVS